VATGRTGAHLSSDRTHIVDAALAWRGTPYHDQASVKGVGCDCLGLLRGVYTEVTGRVPEEPMNYSPAWGTVDKDERLLAAGHKYLEATDYEGWKPGDVLVFRVKNAASAKHCAIVVSETEMVHAVSGRNVCVTSIGAWGSRVAGVFKFPGVK